MIACWLPTLVCLCCAESCGEIAMSRPNHWLLPTWINQEKQGLKALTDRSNLKSTHCALHVQCLVFKRHLASYAVSCFSCTYRWFQSSYRLTSSVLVLICGAENMFGETSNSFHDLNTWWFIKAGYMFYTKEQGITKTTFIPSICA